MISATIQKAAETISRLDALRKKMAVSAYLKKKRAAQHNRARIKERRAAELLIERALQPFFVDQIESAAKALAATVAPEGTKVFCPTGPGGGVDATCGRGGSGFKNISTGKVTIGGVYWYDEDGEEVELSREEATMKIRSSWYALTGKKTTLSGIAKAVGIPDGCTIAIMGREDFGGIEVRGDSEELGISAICRTVSEEYGGAAIYNDELTVSKRYREKGLGTKILASQVENASTYGFTKIVTGASKAPDTNGYYTWARLGYDGPIKKETQEALPPSLKGAERVSDMMKTKEGREWWKDNGTGFRASFSLEKGSQSRKVLDEYVAAKFGSKSEGGKSSGDGGGGRGDLGQDLGQPQSTKSTQQTLPIIFNPKDWNQKLVDTLYPAMVKIAVVGMDGEMRRMGLQIKRGFAETKVFCPTGPGGGVDSSCGKGGSGGGLSAYKKLPKLKSVEVNLEDEEAEEEMTRVTESLGLTGSLKSKKTAATLAALAGAPDGADVEIGVEDYQAFVKWKSPKGASTVYFPFADDDVPEIMIEEINLEETGTGLGTKLFAQQAAMAESLGVKKIVTNAVGYPGGENGYYTWARLGFDATVEDLDERQRESIQTDFPDATSVQDVMKTPEGRSWWKENGGEFQGEFNVEEGSQSRKVLDEYVEAKFGSKTEDRKSSGDDGSGRSDPGQDLGLDGQAKGTKVFCPTGPGGGVDATCKPGGSSALPDIAPDHRLTLGRVIKIAQKATGSTDNTLESHCEPFADKMAKLLRSRYEHAKIVGYASEGSPVYHVFVETYRKGTRKKWIDASGIYDSPEDLLKSFSKANPDILDEGDGFKPIDSSSTNTESSHWEYDSSGGEKTHTSTKSTATDLLDGLDDSGGLLDFEVLDTPYGPVNMAFLFEYPDWMKQAITEFLRESFAEPYWDELNKTTYGDIEKYLQEGIKEGWSIERMASEMAPQLLEEGRYAQIRGRNIARTEAGHALNGARSMGIDSVIAELQGTGLDIQKLWNSVLGTTTRDSHRAIHGVPADQDGTWLLAGVRCRWPGDVVLPPSERCNCQCTLETAFGMSDSEARELIQIHEGKMASAVWSELRTKVFSIKCGGEGGTPGPCPLNKPEVKPARKPRKPKVEKPVESDSDEKPKAKPEKAGEFKKFKNGKEAEEILAKSAKQWMDGPADDYFANKGVKAYAGTSESFRINDCLRQKCGDKGLDSKAADLKKVIDKAAFPESIESHRSINPKTPEERAALLSFFEKRVGQSFVDSAFVSTTANKAYAKTWSKGAKAEPISISVHVKSGSKAIYVPKDITGRQEWEVLIQSGSKFRVKSVEGSSVVMELENE